MLYNPVHSSYLKMGRFLRPSQIQVRNNLAQIPLQTGVICFTPEPSLFPFQHSIVESMQNIEPGGPELKSPLREVTFA